MLWWKLRKLKSKSWQTRRDAAESLSSSKNLRAVEALIFALEDEDSVVRFISAESLGVIGSKKAVPKLISSLDDEEWIVREHSAQSLGKIGDERAVEPLTKVLADKQSKAYLADEEGRSRQAAAEALGKIGDVKAVESLTTILRDATIKGLFTREAAVERGVSFDVPPDVELAWKVFAALLCILQNKAGEVASAHLLQIAGINVFYDAVYQPDRSKSRTTVMVDCQELKDCAQIRHLAQQELKRRGLLI